MHEELPILPTLGNRLKVLRQRKGITQVAVSDAVGVTPAAVSAWERDVDEPIRENYVALAKFYDVPLDYLYGEEPTPIKETPGWQKQKFEHPIEDPGFYNYLPYGGIVEAGTFRPADLLNQIADNRKVKLARLDGFIGARQIAYEVKGDSMDLRGILEGMWAIGIEINDYSEILGRHVQNEQLVVVRRTRFQGSEIELTVKEVRLFKDRTELIPRSKNPMHKVFVIPKVHEEGDEVIEIAAVVAWAGFMFMT